MRKNLNAAEKVNPDRRYLTFQNMFWLFMLGNIGGFVLEGFFCLFKYGSWESHVVTVWGPFCLIYGIGMVIFYTAAVLLRNKNIPPIVNALLIFVVIGLIASAFELICGLLLEFAMGMRAWNYSRHFLNVRGHISLKMTVVWGLFGVGFTHIAVRPLERLFELIKGKTSKIACVILSAFMAVNLSVTLGCMVRWKQRLDGQEHKTRIGKTIDRFYDDERMAKRFVEWRLLEPQSDDSGSDED